MSAPPATRHASPEQRDPHARLYALASLLLQYPEPDLLTRREAVVAAAEALPSSPQRAALRRFLVYWLATPGTRLAEEYVATFDLQKRCGLYLSYYLFGDRRQRGVTFLRLKQLYEAAGWELTSRELPDYLPLMLEFAANAPAGYGEAVLQEFRPSLELLRLGLHDLVSPYVHVLDAVTLGLPRLTHDQREAVLRLAADGPPTEQVGLEPCGPLGVMPSVREVSR